jgi:hypothetical protein
MRAAPALALVMLATLPLVPSEFLRRPRNKGRAAHSGA